MLSSAFGAVRAPDFGLSDGVGWYLMVVLICVSLMTHDVEHLFVVLFHGCQKGPKS